MIRVRVEEPDCSDLQEALNEWDYTVNEGAHNIIPFDAPEPL